jgi:hypothetical protein
MRWLLLTLAMLAGQYQVGLRSFAPAIPPAYVNSCTTGSSGQATTCAITGVTSGHALYPMQYNGGGSALTLTFTDSQGNSYSTVASKGLATDGDTIAIGCAIAGSSGTDTITFKSAGSASPVFGVVYEASNGSCGVDVSASSNTLSATSCTSGSLTTTVPNDFLVGFCGLSGFPSTFAAGSGWSHGLNPGNSSSLLPVLGEVQVATATGSFTATSGTIPSQEQATIEVAFKP